MWHHHSPIAALSFQRPLVTSLLLSLHSALLRIKRKTFQVSATGGSRRVPVTCRPVLIFSMPSCKSGRPAFAVITVLYTEKFMALTFFNHPSCTASVSGYTSNLCQAFSLEKFLSPSETAQSPTLWTPACYTC